MIDLNERINELRETGEALDMDGEAVLKRILKAAVVFEPTERATARDILVMLPEKREMRAPV